MTKFRDPRAVAAAFRRAAATLEDLQDAQLVIEYVQKLEDAARKREAEKAAKDARRKPWLLAAPKIEEEADTLVK